ncbi:unnamed protein product [Linum trigynum]|uniref:Uncharacterized protein n=1 Tax=Linum trigynum TaxID=586398 RepID=A0AAV2E760_9ROSI
MTRSNPTPLVLLDEDINRTLRLLARERELAEARRRSERGGQQLGSGVSGEVVEEVEVEPVIEEEMVEKQRQDGAAQVRHMNEEAGEEGAPRTMGVLYGPKAGRHSIAYHTSSGGGKQFRDQAALVTMIQNNALFHDHESKSPREHVQRFL